MSRRAKSAGSRLSQRHVEADDPNSYNIRFDYSATYQDNEELAMRLEDQAYELHREQYRANVESDLVLKQAKKEADKTLQLKEKIKNRDPNESSNRVLNSAKLKRRPSLFVDEKPKSQKSKNRSKSLGGDAICNQTESTANQTKADATDGANLDMDDGKFETNDEPQEVAKPMHTLTMFLLSIQALKRPLRSKKQDQKDDKQDKLSFFASDKSLSKKQPTRQSSLITSTLMPSRRPSSYHAGDASTAQGAISGVEDANKNQYGIHVRKDFTRSRRTLEEISRLEQDSKYGYVNKYEERRKRLLSQCKDTKPLQERIHVFLKEIDQFKVLSTAENSLEKVLLRSKQARLHRAPTFAW